MNYSETLNYLFTRLPMFSRQGVSAYKKDLTNTLRLCEALGNPHHKLKTIHVAGTNGKGSTSHMLAAILQTAGYKTGLYTSPHLKDFRERIKINGIMCEEDFVVDFTRSMKKAIEEIEPSFFEITVAMAMEYFVRHQVDVAVIEVGLGGRLDSTNIINPELSIITNIGRDHMNLLGNKPEEIAYEKAGIIKTGVPAIIGEATELTRQVFEKQAYEINAPLIFAQEQRWTADWKYDKDLLEVSVAHHHNDERHTYRLDLGGLYQMKNLLPVLEAVTILEKKGWVIYEEHLKFALQNVKKLTGLHGRWQIIHHNPMLVLDVAHNEDGIRQLNQQIEITDPHQLHIIIGLVKDKEIKNILGLLPTQATYYFTRAAIERALPENILMEEAGKQGLWGRAFGNVNAALQAAIDAAGHDDLVLVCGSVFVVGEVEKELLHFKKQHS